MEKQVYQVIILMEDDIVFKAFVQGPEGIEVELLDFYYQKYWSQVPDITKYSVKNISEAFDKEFDLETENIAQVSLALNAVEYSTKYN